TLAALIVAGGLVELLRVRHDHRRYAVQEGGLAAAGRPEDGCAGAPGLHYLQPGIAAPVEDLDLLDAVLPGRDRAHDESRSPASLASSSPSRAPSSASPSGGGDAAGPAAWRNAASRRRISSAPMRGTTTGEMLNR